MEDKYIIIDINTMDYMKDEHEKIMYYETEDDARQSCWIHELPDAWVCKLVYNYKEERCYRSN